MNGNLLCPKILQSFQNRNFNIKCKRGLRHLYRMAAKGDTGMIELDGGVLEGGGQILRNASALSCLLNQPIRVYNIRAGRQNPGLRPQHLTGLQLLNKVCNGRLEGGNVGSTEIIFHPGKVQPGPYSADTKTAGSVCLIMQAVLPCLCMGGGETTLTLKGGTNADMAPQIDYQVDIFKPIAEKFGFHFDVQLKKRGFYPKGGGEVVVTGYPIPYLKPITMMDQGKITRISGRAFVAGVLPKKVAHTMAITAKERLLKQHNCNIYIDAIQETADRAFGNGSGIILVAETDKGCVLAGCGLGKRGLAPEQVAIDAADDLLNNIDAGSCVDSFLQDQLILLMALAKGKSTIKCGSMTLHTQTAIHVAKSITQAKFEVTEVSKTVTIIECEGIGIQNIEIE